MTPPFTSLTVSRTGGVVCRFPQATGIVSVVARVQSDAGHATRRT